MKNKYCRLFELNRKPLNNRATCSPTIQFAHDFYTCGPRVPPCAMSIIGDSSITYFYSSRHYFIIASHLVSGTNWWIMFYNIFDVVLALVRVGWRAMGDVDPFKIS